MGLYIMPKNMKTRLLTLFTLGLLVASGSASAQQLSARRATSIETQRAVRRAVQGEMSGQASSSAPTSSATFFGHNAELPASITLPGATPLNIGGKYDRQTNARALHNVQVDPENPMNIHAVVMTASGTPADTIAYGFPSRRVYYTFSSNGGTTWTTPKAVGNVRLGYPDMILWKRGGKNVPIISAHRADPAVSTNLISAVFVEKGAPGDGNFAEIDCSHKDFNGDQKDLLWPTIAVTGTEAGSKLYVVSDYSTPTCQTATPDFFELGTITLNADGTGTFDGWKGQPSNYVVGGVASNDPAGFSSNGNHIVRVSENGKIGIVWVNPDAGIPDHSLYYTSSTDGGATWDSIKAVFPPAFDQNNNRGLGANAGLDFFYKNNVPYFTWLADEQIMGRSDSNGYYFPYTSQVFFWTPGRPLNIINYSFAPGYTLNFSSPLGEHDTALYLYQTPYITDAPQDQSLKFPDPGLIAYPTFARSSDPNVYSIYYYTVQENDTAVVTDENGNSETHWYGSIYYQKTVDDGMTWSEPTKFLGNTSGDANRVDYHYAETSSWNEYTGGIAKNHIIFQADLLAGTFVSTTSPSYDSNYWYHTVATFASVQPAQPSTFRLAQNYPNPFNPSTTISFDLKQNSKVVLSVTDMLGRTVATLVNATQSAGHHDVKFDASNLPSGVYQYTLKTNGESFTQRMVLSK